MGLCKIMISKINVEFMEYNSIYCRVVNCVSPETKRKIVAIQAAIDNERNWGPDAAKKYAQKRGCPDWMIRLVRQLDAVTVAEMAQI